MKRIILIPDFEEKGDALTELFSGDGVIVLDKTMWDIELRASTNNTEVWELHAKT